MYYSHWGHGGGGVAHLTFTVKIDVVCVFGQVTVAAIGSQLTVALLGVGRSLVMRTL